LCQKYVDRFLKTPALVSFFLQIEETDRKEFLEEKYYDVLDERIKRFINFLEDPDQEQEIDEKTIKEVSDLIFKE
jgi:hypothetical protein